MLLLLSVSLNNRKTTFAGYNGEQLPFKGRGCYWFKGKAAKEFGFYSLDVMEMKRLDFVMKEEVVSII
jgi:hypothetical protein